jgi:hypothetical protein
VARRETKVGTSSVDFGGNMVGFAISVGWLYPRHYPAVSQSSGGLRCSWGCDKDGPVLGGSHKSAGSPRLPEHGRGVDSCSAPELPAPAGASRLRTSSCRGAHLGAVVEPRPTDREWLKPPFEHGQARERAPGQWDGPGLSRRSLGIPGWGDCVRGYMSMQGKDK